MFGSDILDVAIGLVLVYLIFSVLLTSVCEGIESILKTRALDLEHAILQIIQQDKSTLQKIYDHPLISGLYRGGYEISSNNPKFLEIFSRHRAFPSYIPREIFSAALTDIMQGDCAANAKLTAAYKSLKQIAGVDDKALRKSIEDWYDSAMDRASGWFKRRTQLRLFILGLTIAIVANINSVTIAQYLAVHPAAREEALILAKNALSSPPEAARKGPAEPVVGAGENAGSEKANDSDVTTPESPAAQSNKAFYEDYSRQLAAIGLPIGWSEASTARTIVGFPSYSAPGSTKWGTTLRGLFYFILLVLGYVATAFAVMLGAPFWFDLLNKLMVVRSTVKPKEKSPDEPPVDGPDGRGIAAGDRGSRP